MENKNVPNRRERNECGMLEFANTEGTRKLVSLAFEKIITITVGVLLNPGVIVSSTI